MKRRKGQLYFQNSELTGTTEKTTGKKTKMSLEKVYKDIIIPAIEEKIVKRFDENGKVKVLIAKQEDNAGPHGKQKYLTAMHHLFWVMRKWILFNQPSQSAATNVHDACIFPMLSKNVSGIQALFYGACLLKGEELYKCVKQAWEDRKNRVVMARAFAGNTQIVSAILKHKGDNNYLSEKGGLSFGIRKTFIPDEDGEGVIAIDSAPANEADTITGNFLMEQELHLLKYKTPTLNDIPDAKLTSEMIQMLNEYMDISNLPNDLKTLWENLFAEWQNEHNVDVNIPVPAVEEVCHRFDYDSDDDLDFWMEPYFVELDPNLDVEGIPMYQM